MLLKCLIRFSVIREECFLISLFLEKDGIEKNTERNLITPLVFIERPIMEL